MDENLPKYKTSEKPEETDAPKIYVLDLSDIIGRTFLMKPQEYGQNFRFHIFKIDEQEPGQTHFICSVNDDKYKKIMS